MTDARIHELDNLARECIKHIGPANSSVTSAGLRLFVAFDRRLPDSRAIEDAERLRDCGARRPFGEIALGAQGRQLLGHSDVDQLIDRDALGFGNFARLGEKRGLQPQCENCSSSLFLLQSAQRPTSDSTAMPSCRGAREKSRRLKVASRSAVHGGFQHHVIIDIRQ